MLKPFTMANVNHYFLKLLLCTFFTSALCYLLGTLVSTSKPTQLETLTNEQSSYTKNVKVKVNQEEMEKSYLENHKGKMPSICDIATNNKWNDITWGSYGVVGPE